MQAAMLLAVLLPVQIPADKAPPQPDFKTPVDYVHWYNSFVRTGKRENAWDEYRMLLGDGAENKGMPLLEAWESTLQAATQLEGSRNIIGNLVAIGNESLVYDDVLAALDSGTIKGDDIRRTEAVIKRTDKQDFDWAGTMAVEQAEMLDG